MWPTDGGFVVTSNEGEIRFVWPEVLEVVAFKRDLLTSDSIRLAFRRGPGNRYLEIGEEMEGFSTLVAAMHQNLSGIPEDWLQLVTQPPFATNVRRIFGTAPDRDD